jgi:hypothetical protein
MFWLDFSIPLDNEFEIEKQVRHIQASTDIDELRHIAVALVRFCMQQAHVSSQIVTQMAEIEADMISAGHIAEPTAEHQRMAAEILAAHRASS